MDSLEAFINEAIKQFKAFTFTVPKFDKKFHKYDYKIEMDDSVKSFNFDLHIPDVEIPDVDSILRNEMKNLENFNLNEPLMNDSLMKWFNFYKSDDSTYSGNQMHFEFRMKEFEEEMEKFREEMDKLKMEIRKDSIRIKSKKPVEI